MSDLKLKSDQAHTRYTNAAGKRLPGVTTVTGVLDKPALKYWANKIGLEGIDVNSYVDKRAEMGTCAHDMIEAYLMGMKQDVNEWAPVVLDQAENSFLSFLEGMKGYETKIVGVELKLISEKFQVGGTCDIIWYWDGVLTLTDLKTGKGVYPEMFVQASAYAALARENGYAIEQVSVLNVPRADDEKFAHPFISHSDEIKYFEIFMHCKDIYDLKKEVAWR